MSDISKEVGSLLCAVTTGSFDMVYGCGHYSACKYRLQGFYPVISIWGDPRFVDHSPRLLDLESAIELSRLSEVSGIEGVEGVDGNWADYRVIPKDE